MITLRELHHRENIWVSYRFFVIDFKLRRKQDYIRWQLIFKYEQYCVVVKASKETQRAPVLIYSVSDTAAVFQWVPYGILNDDWKQLSIYMLIKVKLKLKLC